MPGFLPEFFGVHEGRRLPGFDSPFGWGFSRSRHATNLPGFAGVFAGVLPGLFEVIRRRFPLTNVGQKLRHLVLIRHQGLNRLPLGVLVRRARIQRGALQPQADNLLGLDGGAPLADQRLPDPGMSLDERASAWLGGQAVEHDAQSMAVRFSNKAGASSGQPPRHCRPIHRGRPDCAVRGSFVKPHPIVERWGVIFEPTTHR